MAHDLQYLQAVLNWATIAGNGQGVALLDRNPQTHTPLNSPSTVFPQYTETPKRPSTAKGHLLLQNRHPFFHILRPPTPSPSHKIHPRPSHHSLPSTEAPSTPPSSRPPLHPTSQNVRSPPPPLPPHNAQPQRSPQKKSQPLSPPLLQPSHPLPPPFTCPKRPAPPTLLPSSHTLCHPKPPNHPPTQPPPKLGPKLAALPALRPRPAPPRLRSSPWPRPPRPNSQRSPTRQGDEQEEAWRPVVS